MLYRIRIKRETKNYFIGKAYDNKRYKIEKNQYSNKLRVGSDSYFYARRKEGFLATILIPVSDEEAGVLDIHNSR
ncbi:hypothetical protein ABFP60_09465 [Clostridioides difficile]